MKKKRKLLFKIVGWYLVILGILAFVNSYTVYGAIPLWFSYITLLFIGIGVLNQKPELIAVQLNIILIPVIFWNIDFFYHLILGKPLWGSTDYLFNGGFVGSLGNFISMHHIYILPLALSFIIYFGLKRTDLWKWSFIEVLAIFVLSVLISPVERNFNCVLRSCVNFIQIPTPVYQVLWMISMLALVYITNLILVKIAAQKPLKSR